MSGGLSDARYWDRPFTWHPVKIVISLVYFNTDLKLAFFQFEIQDGQTQSGAYGMRVSHIFILNWICQVCEPEFAIEISRGII